MFNLQTAWQDIAAGNPDACTFIEVFYSWVHRLDDVVDRDAKLDPADTVGLNLQALFTFAENPFYQQHQAFLKPVIVLSAVAYLASEERKNHADVLERITAQVLKSEYMNVFFAVAYCVGGWGHALAMSRKYRDYAFDAEPVKV